MTMQYNTYIPGGYQPVYPTYQQAAYQQLAQTPQGQSVQQPPIQNTGFISVRSETEARNYPVAPGNSITFKDENTPYVYTKTMGFSQLDRPVFERFRLVKEDDIPPQTNANAPQGVSAQQPVPDITDMIKGEITALKSAYGTMRADIDALRAEIDKASSVAAVEISRSKLTKEDDEA